MKHGICLLGCRKIVRLAEAVMQLLCFIEAGSGKLRAASNPLGKVDPLVSNNIIAFQS